MAALKVKGKVIKLLPVVTGEGKKGPWTKQEFIIETSGDYPKQICFSAWNDTAEKAKTLKIGSVADVSFAPESREYNERWYTDLRAYKIDADGTQASPVKQQSTTQLENEEEEGEDLPF